MNMGLALNIFASLFILDSFNFRQMSFGVKIEFFVAIRVHHELSEFIRDRVKRLRRYIVFTKSESDS